LSVYASVSYYMIALTTALGLAGKAGIPPASDRMMP
jgi:hypothetical protein